MRAPRRPTTYRIEANRHELTVSFDENFFSNAFTDDKGTTALDENIAVLVQEIRTALYYLGTEGTPH